MPTIVIDAGHGGFDNGARYQGRREKDDNLRLALAVGQLLEQRGYNVIYTRTDDIYQSPYEKAQIANDAGADYFISFHRNSGENDNTYSGIQTLIYGGDERAEEIADSINQELEKTGFTNLGIDERTGLVVLRRTEMPAVLIEAGFINNDKDNQIFDEDFEGVAQAIADGIENAIQPSSEMRMEQNQDDRRNQENRMRQENRMDWDDDMNWDDADRKESEDDGDKENVYYGVEAGRFRHFNTANFLAEQLKSQGFDAFVFKEDGIIRVIAGKERELENILHMQNQLRRLGYVTMIISTEMD
ncbi:MAG: N-acetylmuramoyl-L-alanine amidase [Lachnospiraceae bacterium]|nr:N-acetylmuramoyl-L-alanine amidase [Lachnospiraceae bacterium]